jgi:hypothetical protein
MAIATIRNNDGAWDKARAVPTGHFVAYLPQPRIFHLYDPSGNKIAETGVSAGVRDFDAYIAANGEVVVHFSSFNNDASPWPWQRWTTGAIVGAGTAPPPPPSTNGPKIEAIRELLRQAQALLDTLT